MKNIPDVKLGVIAVSRDCFVISLSERRRQAVVEAYASRGRQIYECKITVENEKDAMTQEELEQVRDKLLPYLRDVLVERKIEMVFVMLTNIIEETTYLICAGEKADDLVEKAYHVHKEGDYHVLKGVVSRKKQLIPMFMSAMQEQ